MADSETGIERVEASSLQLEEAALHEDQSRVSAEIGLTPRPAHLPPVLLDRLAAIRLLAMDVDGVLTDGSIVWSANPRGGPVMETKAFSVKDGLGISLARVAGLQIAWITGRTSSIVERRAVELGVSELHQWARDKARVLEEIKGRHALAATAVAYVGDDLNDVPAFNSCGLRIAVADAVAELRERADWVTEAPGGRGAIREVIEAILRAQGRWEEVVTRFYQRLEKEGDGAMIGIQVFRYSGV